MQLPVSPHQRNTDARPSISRHGFDSHTGHSKFLILILILIPIADAAGARLAFIRPTRPVRYRDLQLNNMTRVSECSVRSHKPRPPGATPGPATFWSRELRVQSREPDST